MVETHPVDQQDGRTLTFLHDGERHAPDFECARSHATILAQADRMGQDVAVHDRSSPARQASVDHLQTGFKDSFAVSWTVSATGRCSLDWP
jgi:hypothetical protein